MSGKDARKDEATTEPQRTGEGARQAEQSASGADQSASDADQTSSDADQTDAERDDADATIDQLASDEDQRVANQRHLGDHDATEDAGYEASRQAREAGTLRRLASHVGRASTARDRGATADTRDATSIKRTGAYRREVGMLTLQHEVDRARRADGRFVVAFIDIDGMKQVNDRDGHAAGDHVLQTLVWTMHSNLRSFDPVVRYGGDEFVAGLGGVDVEEVARRFDAIEQSVEREVGVGFTVGLAELEPDETLEALMERADARLLSAKARQAE